MKTIIHAIAAGIIATAACNPLPAAARPDVLIVREAPPPARAEKIPAARRGHEWIPGYWDWNGRRYTWVAGHHEKIRPGQMYHRPEWRKSRDGWELDRGGWRDDKHARRGNDKDRDGVRDRADDRPNNPNRH